MPEPSTRQRFGRRIKRPWRGPTLLEIHQAHFRNYGTFLTLAEEEYAEDVDRVLVWRAITVRRVRRARPDA